MPKALHDALARQASKKGLTGKAKDRFVFGTMANMKKKQISKLAKTLSGQK